MKFLFKYKDKIVSMGLLPIIGTLIGLHFLPDSQMLGIGALVSLVLLVYLLIFPVLVSSSVWQATIC